MDKKTKEELQEKLIETECMAEFLLNSLELMTKKKLHNCETYVCHGIKKRIKEAQKLIP